MKKIIALIVLIMLVSGCSSTNTSDYEDDYYSMISLINERDEFQTSSSYFDISTDISQISDGSYRYYVTIDNPRNAMYDVEVMAIEKDVDYSSTMAANVGVLTDETYNMIPNQVDTNLGFYEGISVSGISTLSSPVLYVLVQWQDSNTNSIREYFKLEINQ